MPTDVTIRNADRNQAAFDYQFNRLVIGEYTTKRLTYLNNTSGVDSLAIGTVMGIVSATQRLVPFDSTNTDGSQNPVGILLDELTDIADAATVADVIYLNGGEVNSNQLVFDRVGDSLTTTVAVGGVTKTVEDWLITNGNNFIFRGITDQSSFDV